MLDSNRRPRSPKYEQREWVEPTQLYKVSLPACVVRIHHNRLEYSCQTCLVILIWLDNLNETLFCFAGHAPRACFNRVQVPVLIGHETWVRSPGSGHVDETSVIGVRVCQETCACGRMDDGQMWASRADLANVNRSLRSADRGSWAGDQSLQSVYQVVHGSTPRVVVGPRPRLTPLNVYLKRAR